jgi:hypothetical protein
MARGGRTETGNTEIGGNGYCRKLLFSNDEAGSSVRGAQEESSTITMSSSLEEVDHVGPCSTTSNSFTWLRQRLQLHPLQFRPLLSTSASSMEDAHQVFDDLPVQN